MIWASQVLAPTAMRGSERERTTVTSIYKGLPWRADLLTRREGEAGSPARGPAAVSFVGPKTTTCKQNTNSNQLTQLALLTSRAHTRLFMILNRLELIDTHYLANPSHSVSVLATIKSLLNFKLHKICRTHKRNIFINKIRIVIFAANLPFGWCPPGIRPSPAKISPMIY